MLQISRTLLNKYDFKASSIIDLNLGSLIFLGGEGYRAMGYIAITFLVSSPTPQRLITVISLSHV